MSYYLKMLLLFLLIRTIVEEFVLNWLVTNLILKVLVLLTHWKILFHVVVRIQVVCIQSLKGSSKRTFDIHITNDASFPCISCHCPYSMIKKYYDMCSDPTGVEREMRLNKILPLILYILWEQRSQVVLAIILIVVLVN